MTAPTIARGSATVQVATFAVGAEEYAVDVMQVQEIVRVSVISKVPRSPQFVEGVINLRGRIIPVIDLARRFELPGGPRTKSTRVIITLVEGRTVGMLVDTVTEVLKLPHDAMVAAPPLCGGKHAEFISGIAKVGERILIMLDLTRVLSQLENHEFNSHQEAVGHE